MNLLGHLPRGNTCIHADDGDDDHNDNDESDHDDADDVDNKGGFGLTCTESICNQGFALQKPTRSRCPLHTPGHDDDDDDNDDDDGDGDEGDDCYVF